MSIIKLEETFKNKEIVYCSLNNKIIIKCIPLTKLFPYRKYNNKKIIFFKCDKIKIITIYDIYKNIISEFIQTDMFEKTIKNNEILENLKEKNIYFFKTFIRAFIRNNKLNGIQYHIDHTGRLYKILYDNIIFSLNYFLKYTITIKKKNYYYNINVIDNRYYICYFDYKDIYIYKYFICFYSTTIIIYGNNNDIINIIYCNREKLQILKIVTYCENIKLYKEKRNFNNEITVLKKYDNIGTLKENFISNNKNPPFSKPLKKSYIKLINYYNENIININKQIILILKKFKKEENNLLFYYNLEIIN